MPKVDKDIAQTVSSDTLKKSNPLLSEDTILYGKTFPSKFAQKIDSINRIETGKIFRKSLFTGHQLQCKNINSLSTHTMLPSWLTIIAVLLIYGLVRIKISYNKRIKQIMNGLYAVRYVAQINREDGIFNHKGALELFLIFVFSSAMLIYFYYANITEMALSSFKWSAFLKISGIIIVIYLVKTIIYSLFARIIRLEKELSMYLTNVILFNEALGLALMPIVIIIIYMPYENKEWLYYIALFFFSALYIFRFVRGITIVSSTSKFSKLYLFLYLCTLEILPLLLIIKYLLDFKGK